eukprot:Tamp_33107.p1 GENE.Tamp_33107~~Tamp_33107.p1  ORF type:complete len:210 (+),score=20.44 Tamp_33107:83-631(+)
MARVSEMMPAYKTVVGSRRRCRHALRSAKNTADPRMMKAWCGLAVLGAAACALLALSERRARRTRLMFRTKVKKEKLAKYIRHHRAVWPEVQEGLRRHGVRLLSIHMPKDGGNELYMFVEVAEGADMARDLGPGSQYRANERVRLWEETMCTYFENASWEQLEELYTLTPSTSTNTLPPVEP